MPQNRRKRRTGWIILILLLALVGGIWLTWWIKTRVSPPAMTDNSMFSESIRTRGDGLFSVGNNRLQKNAHGLWELYLEGDAFDRGVANGRLCRKLMDFQEEAFIARIRTMIPDESYLKFLKYVIYWFNRDLDEYLPEEYKEEIYGISLSASEKFNFIGTPYQRMLNYHSAHDIGHALQDLALVGCTSFAVWGDKSADSTLIIGRNFDFYMGDDFAANRIVCFEKPEKGHKFMMVTWAGMIGTVSGMNDQGLTVTINAAKSDIPYSARTPISILAREILQYASDIKEAYAISKKRETFVSESILIGSANDGIAAIIEKAPSRPALLMPVSNYIICANHYQSPEFINDPANVENMRKNASVYRFNNLRKAIDSSTTIDVMDAARILRDRCGKNGADIGMGNEKALNQLLAHHSIIFEPCKRLVWVSTGPWQSGSYICYNLNKIFNTFASLQQKEELTEADRTIPPDPFLKTSEYKRFLQYKVLRDSLQMRLKKGEPTLLTGSFADRFIALNPEYYEGYKIVGDCFFSAGNPRKGLEYYAESLKKEIPRKAERDEIISGMSKCIVQLEEHQK